MIALRQWGERWSGSPPGGSILSDSRDKKPVRPVAIQAWDGRTLDLGELCWVERECASGNAASEPVRCTGPGQHAPVAATRDEAFARTLES